jgi:hypothetical protein
MDTGCCKRRSCGSLGLNAGGCLAQPAPSAAWAAWKSTDLSVTSSDTFKGVQARQHDQATIGNKAGLSLEP